jgi:hypothetical protein
MQSLAQDRLYKKLKMEADPDVQLYNKASALYENLFIDKSKFHKTQQQGDNTSVNQLEAFLKKYKGGHDSPDKTDEKTDAEKALEKNNELEEKLRQEFRHRKSKERIQKLLCDRLERRRKSGLPNYEHEKVTFSQWYEE